MIIAGLYSCNTSAKYFKKNSINCPNYIELDKGKTIYFVKNKEFRNISTLLKTSYGAISIRHIFFIKSKNIYYCEFYSNSYIINCLILGKNMEIISQKEIHFDY